MKILCSEYSVRIQEQSEKEIWMNNTQGSAGTLVKWENERKFRGQYFPSDFYVPI